MRLTAAVFGLASLAACAESAGTPGPDAGAADADAGPDAGGPRYAVPEAVGRLPASGLPELSGLVASRSHADLLWAVNDSGNPAVLHALDLRGARRGTYTVEGASNVDWEDLALDVAADGARLYVADVGDNAARETDGASGRAAVQLYRVAEPDPAAGDATLRAERIDLVYPDRPFDCEAVFVDPRSGDVYLVTKSSSPAPVFVARAPLAPGTTVTLSPAGVIDLALATAADMSGDGTRVVVRGYRLVRAWTVPPAATLDTLFSRPFVAAMAGSAAEAIAFERDGYGLYTVAEGDAATLYHLAFRP